MDHFTSVYDRPAMNPARESAGAIRHRLRSMATIIAASANVKRKSPGHLMALATGEERIVGLRFCEWTQMAMGRSMKSATTNAVSARVGRINRLSVNLEQYYLKGHTGKIVSRESIGWHGHVPMPPNAVNDWSCFNAVTRVWRAI